MKKSLLLVILFAFTSVIYLQAQDVPMHGWEACSQKKMQSQNPLPLGGDSPNTPKHKYDVIEYKLNLDIRNCFITPFPRSFTGSVIIKFRIDTTLTSIQLNAVNTSLQIDSVGLSGVSFTHTGNILTVTLNRSYNQGEVTQVKINYKHLNVSDGAIYTGSTSNPGGFFTDAEPEGARKWFPCWDKPSDKAMIDMTVKVPANVKIGGNGRLNDSTLTGDSLYYHWVSREPVATYLVVLTGKVNYNLNIVYWHKISNPLDSIPIRFYYNAGENPTNIQNIIGDMTTYFSTKFSEHQFEKNGFTTAPAPGFTWGGMENQTLTTLCANCWSANLVSHEYAHQWFGDMVTCGTWGDIWLNEGFATYAEALWYEHTTGYTAYKNDINSDASYYLSNNPGWPMYNPSWAENTPDVGILFNTAITYNKGACVLHMLRYVLQDTNTFFNCLRVYASDTLNFRNKNGVTDDFTNLISLVAGQNLGWFIDQWVKQPNHPVYANIYQITGSGSNWTVGFQARQTQTNTPFHKMPIVVKITFTSGPDTTFRVMNDVNDQIFYWNLDRQPATVVFDPNNDIVLKVATTVPGLVGITNLNEVPFTYNLSQNYPNPFNPVTTFNYEIAKRGNVSIKIYDVTGKLVIQPVNEMKNPGKYQYTFHAGSLASGVYYYEIKSNSFTDTKKMVLVK
ncbi:MAG: T9SS C-terminal target domain-containing protein [Ignavibacteriae bacterium]|nr:MAG: T9SS C-terminal target domain-containing protein [Ignavibacteriota bacterium]